MKGEIIINEITYECLFEDGSCKYKNPENIKKCGGCDFSKVIKSVVKDKQTINYDKGEIKIKV